MSVLSTSRQPTKGQLLASFTNGVRPDQELYKQEIAVQKAWAQGLSEIGLLTSDELQLIDHSLSKAEGLIQLNQFDWREEDEDIHMNLERFVNEETNGLGKKMHAGRSRNDLIATTLKLNVADNIVEISTLLKNLTDSMLGLADANKDVIIPGMTHLQNGQPIRWSHAILAHAWAFKRDIDKFQNIRTDALKCMPLGSAALSGTTLPIDLKRIANTLGFNSPSMNSYDAVGDRDVVINFLQATAHFGIHLSRFAEDIIYWSSAPVGLVELSPEWSTGSSIMPNKRNPDVAELSRAKASLWMGDLNGVMTLMKGLATSYASDLHETKIPYLRVANDIKLTLSVFTPFVSELSVNREKAKTLLGHGHILATEIANHMTDQGVPFREAYSIVAAMVELADSQKVQVHELSLNQIQTFSKHITPQFMENLSFESTVEKRKYSGGSSLDQVNSQIATLKNFQ